MTTSKGGKKLRITIRGRIIDHLGIQMYQSPVAAVAELISNAWDADAENVRIFLPERLGEKADITIKDDGVGMTFEECEARYLNVGWCRRGDEPDERSKEKNRSILGRKGIGKFAGFGISEIIHVETISKVTGEKTVFELDINKLRSDQYTIQGGDIPVNEYLGPDKKRRKEHGTKITLKSLKLERCPPESQFSRGMARRFVLHQRAADFKVFVNNRRLPESENDADVEFTFPAAYRNNEKPNGMVIEDGWGVEKLSNGREVRWRIHFYESPIGEEELRGVSIFSRGKLAQNPFFFDLSGGLGGQHGQQYMSGQVQADYLDQLDTDLIATERQRVKWDHAETIPLLEWGRERVVRLLRIWHDRRGEERIRELKEKVSGFAQRLKRLQPHESRTVERALEKVAQIPTLNKRQFEELGDGILMSWEQGRLRELIDHISEVDALSESELLSILVEAQVMTALNTAEAVKTKLLIVGGLKMRIEKRDLEGAIRDYIAEHPFLIAPEWETYRVERSLRNLVKDLAKSLYENLTVRS